MDNWFEFRGKKSTDFHLILREGHHIGSPDRDAEFISIPGRNGDLIRDNERFENFDDEYDCALMVGDAQNIEAQARAVKAWLQSEFSYGYLRDYNDLDYYREAVCTSKIDIEKTLAQIGWAKIIFNCKPFKKSLVGLETVTLTTEKTLYNAEAFKSEPYLKVYGSGDVTIYVNNQSINLKGIEDYIEIDSEMKNCFKDTQAQNDRLRSDWPVFLPGENNISWTGTVDKLEIIPKWRTLGA
ncbi:phage tail domain-containing protein [Sporolactobacillus terrae]|uniref:Siphovirus-type tail component RIFT-related domain-containing protein n=1 Tax=Sporolactobacillus terrae TaxID=269673 RepID=A0A5K7WZP0_9BACL|nr:phage tail domain-containing protein [Sporolactobacillus terrae]BBN99154.1 hypothetical protein St703_18590 [Sporolactobacillus terrae]